MTVHAWDCSCDAYGCRMRRKGITLSSAATPTRGRRQPFRPMQQPSWEAGVAGEHRRDGSFMPYLGGNLEPLSVKQFADNRRKLEGIRDSQLRDPDFAQKAS